MFGAWIKETTGGAFTPEVQAFADQHLEQILPKPIDVRELRERVTQLCTRPREQREAS